MMSFAYTNLFLFARGFHFGTQGSLILELTTLMYSHQFLEPLLDMRTKLLDQDMLLTASYAIASLVEET